MQGTMSEYVLPLIIGAAGLAAVAMLIAILIGILARRRFSRLSLRLHEFERAQAQLSERFHGLTAGAVGQGQRLAQFEQHLGRLRERLDQLASSGGTDGAAFNTAIRLARKGIAAREIMEACGLSEMEASLVVLLHHEHEQR